MAHKPQRQDSQASSTDSDPSGRSISQAVVELVQVERGGLVFWARQRFEIGNELQVRMLRSSLPPSLTGDDSALDSEWVSIRGFVVACRGHRKTDGSFGFRVSLLLDPMIDKEGETACEEQPEFPQLRDGFEFGRVFGLN